MKRLFLALCTLVLFSASATFAATKVWISTNSFGALWSDGANWQGGVAPVNGDRLAFPAGAQFYVTNDLVNAVFDGIDVGENLIISGNPFTLTSATPLMFQDELNVDQAVRFASASPTIAGGNFLVFFDTVTFAGGTARIEAPNAQVAFYRSILEESPTSLVLNVFETTLSQANSFSGTFTANAGGNVTAYYGALGSSTSGTTVSAYSFHVNGYRGQALAEPLNFTSVPFFSFDANALTSPITFSGTTIFVAADVPARIVGPVSGSGRMIVGPYGPEITLAATNTFTGGLQVGGQVRVDGWDALPAAGEVVIEQGGRLDLGTYWNVVRRFTCEGTLAVTAGGFIAVTEGAELPRYCKLDLTVPPGFVAPNGEMLIINNFSATPIVGNFEGLPEGSMVMVNGATRYITYTGGGGNDVVLRPTQGSPYPAAAPNIKDMWWTPLENGWGMSIVQHGNNLFGVIYAYDALGKPTWFVMPAGGWNQAYTRHEGQVYAPRGSPFFQYDAASFVPGPGIGNIVIALDNNVNPTTAVVDYTIDGVTGRKFLSRQPFGNGTNAHAASRADMYWGGVSQTGWGLAILQQGDTLFNVWFTYDVAGAPTWLVMPGGKWTAIDTYEGRIYRTLGSPWLGRQYEQSQLQVFDSGPYRLRFDGDNATLDYSVDGKSGILRMDKQPF